MQTLSYLRKCLQIIQGNSQMTTNLEHNLALALKSVRQSFPHKFEKFKQEIKSIYLSSILIQTANILHNYHETLRNSLNQSMKSRARYLSNLQAN